MSLKEAEAEMKRLVYSLGFTAKEHIAIAEKLLSEPPKERFDRVVVDKKVANREFVETARNFGMEAERGDRVREDQT